MLSPIRLLRLPNSGITEHELALNILNIDDVFNDIERRRRNEIEKAVQPKINYVQALYVDKELIIETIHNKELKKSECISNSKFDTSNDDEGIENKDKEDNKDSGTDKIDTIELPHSENKNKRNNEQDKQPLIPITMKLQYNNRSELLNSLYQYISLRKRYFFKSLNKNNSSKAKVNDYMDEVMDWNKDLEINQLQNLISLSTFRKNIMTKVEYNTQKDYLLEDNDYINA